MKPWFQLLKCSWFPICIWSFCSSVWSAPSPTACIVAHTSSRMLMIPGGFWWDQDSKAPVQRQLKAPVQWLIRSFLKQGNSSPDSRYHLESQSFPLTKNAINNPIWELPLRPNDGGKSIFKKKKKKRFNFPEVLSKLLCGSLSADSYLYQVAFKNPEEKWKHSPWP